MLATVEARVADAERDVVERLARLVNRINAASCPPVCDNMPLRQTPLKLPAHLSARQLARKVRIAAPRRCGGAG
jgi:hypothetical protein